MARQQIVVDVETNGRDPQRHRAVEVAWRNRSTGEQGVFVPPHDVSAILRDAEIEALRVNRYIDRLATAAQDDEGEGLSALVNQAAGNRLVGSNPAFDEAFLLPLIRELYDTPQLGPPWHHRKLDTASLAMGVLDLDEPIGLAKLCERLGVDPPDHTAAGDVRATCACLDQLDPR